MNEIKGLTTFAHKKRIETETQEHQKMFFPIFAEIFLAVAKIGEIELGEFPLLLAPMEDVSDPPFSCVVQENGADVVYTEFISSEGLIRDAAKSVQKLDIYEKERPVGIQIFGANMDSMLRSVEIVEATKPDIIDINFGCPVKKVVCKGAGAGILKDIPLMVKLTEAMVKHTSLACYCENTFGLGSRFH